MGVRRRAGSTASPIAIIIIIVVYAIYTFADGSEVTSESLRCYFGDSKPLRIKPCIETLPVPEPLLRNRRELPTVQIIINSNETHFKHQDSTTASPTTQLQTDNKLTVQTSDAGSTYSCMAFVPHKDRAHSRVKRADPVVYKCDDGLYCPTVGTAATTITNVTFRGVQGDVTCCRNSECNSPQALHLVERTLTSVSRCFQGSARDKIYSSPCQSLSAACLNKTTSSANHSIYSCDSPSNLCWQYNITTNSCKQFWISGAETTLCCCFTDECNYWDEKHERTGPEIGPRPSSPYESLQQFLNLTWVGYLWSGIAVMVLSVVLAFVLVRRKRKRCTTVSLVSDLRYQRLTANFNAGDTEDVQMLLADNDA